MKSTPSGVVDTNLSYSRVLLYVPHGCFDQWFQIGMSEGLVERLIDVIAVQTHDCKTKKELLRNKIFFHEYWLDEVGQNPKSREKRTTCYSCHMTGMNQLRPALGSVPRDQLQVLDIFNKQFEEYQRLDFGKAIDMTASGPPMGQTIGCASCHNNSYDLEGRGMLNAYHLSDRSVHRITYKMIDSLAMSPLHRTLKSRQFDELKSKIYELTDRQLENLNSTSLINTVQDYFHMVAFRHGGPVSVPIPSAIEALLDAGKLSEDEATRLNADFASAQEEQRLKYKQMTQQYLPELISWLKEPDQSCQGK